jgi:hypothetical protein
VKTAFKDMLKGIEHEINIAAAQTIERALFGKNGLFNIGSFINKLFSGGGRFDLSSIVGGGGNLFGGFSGTGFATGTNFAPGGLALVGERGPELVNLPRGAQVIPNQVLEARRASAAGGQQVHVTNNFIVSGPIDRRSQAQIALQAGIGVQRAIARDA